VELYHELSHLWNARDTDTPSPRWNEGLASFLQGLIHERVDGWEGRRDSETRTLARTQKNVLGDSLLRVVPMLEYGSHGMTGYSYSVGDVMFATLYDLVGEQEFNKIVGGFYQQFANGGGTRDFIAFAKHASPRNLDAFFDDWILTTRWAEVVRGASSIDDLANHYRGTSP
jgi:aminopeptidase N